MFGQHTLTVEEAPRQMLNRRFSQTQRMEARLNDQQGVIDLLMQRYHIDDGDLGKLTAALDSDDAYWSEAAEEAGMTVEQYKQFQQLQRENEALHRAQEGWQEQERVQRQAQQWFQEAQEVARKFKGFDFAQELQNPQFTAMLRAGTPVEHAYKVMHFDELMGNAMQVTAAHTEKAVADNVRARGTRPAENGASTQSAFTVKDDPSKLTRADFEEIARRVARGEIMCWGAAKSCGAATIWRKWRPPTWASLLRATTWCTGRSGIGPRSRTTQSGPPPRSGWAAPSWP